jgi:ribonuclease Z
VVHVVYHSTEGALIPSSATSAGAKVEDLLERTLQTYSPTFAKSTAVNYRLSAIDAGSFPNPIELAATYPPTESSNTTSKSPMIPALPLLEVVVEPFPPKLDLSSVPLPFSNAKRILEEEKKGTWGPILDRFLPQLRMKDDVPFIAAELPESAVEVWPLGTGSAAPSKYRNVSSTLVVLPSLAAYGQAGPGADENPTMFLDCGESTMGQLYRLLPFPDSRRHLKNLRFVFLSHLHADHQLGLVGVLKERWRLWREAGTLPADIPKVVLVAPWKYRLFLDEYSDLEEAGSIRDQSVFVESEAIVDPKCFGNDRKGAGWGGWKGPGSDHPRRSPYNPENLGELFASQGIPLKSFSAIPVLHCPSAFAGMATTLSGFRVSFSGDCRPSTLFAQVARGSDVLVHEATFEDGLESEALAKRHCTVGEAVAVGQE